VAPIRFGKTSVTNKFRIIFAKTLIARIRGSRSRYDALIKVEERIIAIPPNDRGRSKRLPLFVAFNFHNHGKEEV